MKNIKIIYLILGLGIGIILSNILYSISPQIEYIDLSDEDIIIRAEELGYVSIKEKILLKEDKIERDDEDTQIKKYDKEAIEEEKENLEEFIEVKIIEGDTLEDISQKLLELELIEDKEKFILTVEEEEMDKRFAYGTFKVSTNANHNQIIDLLTK